MPPVQLDEQDFPFSEATFLQVWLPDDLGTIYLDAGVEGLYTFVPVEHMDRYLHLLPEAVRMVLKENVEQGMNICRASYAKQSNTPPSPNMDIAVRLAVYFGIGDSIHDPHTQYEKLHRLYKLLG